MTMSAGQSAWAQAVAILAAQYTKTAENISVTAHQTMVTTVDSLINQQVPIKQVTARTADKSGGSNLLTAAKAGVLDAIVLSNSPLLKSSTGEPQVQVKVQVNQQQFELSTKVPIPVGTKVQLSITKNNLAVIIKTLVPPQSTPVNPQATSNIATQTTQTRNTTSAAQHSSSQLLPSNATTNREAVPKPLISTSNQQPSKTEITQAPTPQKNTNAVDNNLQNRQQVIIQNTAEQAIRQSLPQQQPIKLLLPLLYQLQQSSIKELPKPLLDNIARLVAHFPTAERIVQPAELQRAIKNNGTLFEAKLANFQNKPSKAQLSQTPIAQVQASQKQRLGDMATQTGKSNAIQNDFKAITQQLISQLQSLKNEASASATSNATNSSSIDSETVTYAGLDKKLPLTPPPGNQTTDSASKEQNLDIILRQLSRQLLASLARTQLNQLESISNRIQSSPEPNAPVNSWQLEIPITSGNHVDNLELRIEQETQGDSQQDENNTQKAWKVVLNFDLHKLGKLHVQLNVIEKTVSATVWSQQEGTHQIVKQHADELRSNFEKIGVTVKKVDCQIGQPPKQTLPIYKKLVDVRT